MSTVQSVPSWRLPTLPRPASPSARRWLVAGAFTAILGATLGGLMYAGVVPRPSLDSIRHRPSTELDLARARAVALARTRAATVRKPQPQPRPGLHVRDRVAENSSADALFATHSWYVAPPPPPPPAPVAALPPSAPPFPYTFLGSFAPSGEKPVFFLAHGDRVFDAHAGDKIDGVYQFEGSVAGQLVFTYLPLNIKQSIPTGAFQ